MNLALNPTAPVKKEDLADKRLVILFFDLSSLETENLIRSVDAAHDFIAKQTGPQDLMAIATYSSTLSLVQDFTNDRDLLLKILKEISSEESEASATETGYFHRIVGRSLCPRQRSVQCLQYRPPPVGTGNSGENVPGISGTQVPDLFFQRHDYYGRRKQCSDTVHGGQLPTGRTCRFTRWTARGWWLFRREAMPHAASAGGGAFGGSGMMQQRNSLSGSQETLITLSHDTGGRSFSDSNDLSLAMKQVQADTNVYYVLGYFSSNSKEDGKYRKIRVELNRPGLKISHRPGYFAAKAFRQLTQQEKDLQLTQAMNVERPFVDVPLILEADYFRKDNSTNYVPISIEILGDGLQFEEKGDKPRRQIRICRPGIRSKGKGDRHCPRLCCR